MKCNMIEEIKSAEEENEDYDPPLQLQQLLSLPESSGPQDGGEEFTKDTAILLLGLGLDSQEVELFQKHHVGMDKFIKLSHSDLDYIGITSSEKKRHIMMCIQKFRKQNDLPVDAEPEEESFIEDEYNSEDSQAIVHVAKHLQTLSKSLPYVHHRMRDLTGCHFFRSGASTHRTLELVLSRCVQQAVQTRQQLCAFLLELEQIELKKERKCHRPKHKHRLAVLLLTGVCASFVVWIAHHTQAEPRQWLWYWPARLQGN